MAAEDQSLGSGHLLLLQEACRALDAESAWAVLNEIIDTYSSVRLDQEKLPPIGEFKGEPAYKLILLVPEALRSML